MALWAMMQLGMETRVLSSVRMRVVRKPISSTRPKVEPYLHKSPVAMGCWE